MRNNLLENMKTSFVFVSQEIRKQKLHRKLNHVNRSHAFRDLQICACGRMDTCRVDFFHGNASFSWFSRNLFGEFFLNFVQLLTMITGKTYLNLKEFYK